MTQRTKHDKTRFPILASREMTPTQKKAAKAIMSGPRKSLMGPFNAWLRSPDLADRLQRVGEYARFGSILPKRLSELAILITARDWTAQFEWYAHEPMAIEAGLDPAIAAAIAKGKRPTRMKADERVVYDFCTELLRKRRVSDATFEATRRKFGDQGVIDLIGISGYYGVVSMTLNVAQVPIPKGHKRPLRALKR